MVGEWGRRTTALGDIFPSGQQSQPDVPERGVSRSFSFDSVETIANGICQAVQLGDIDTIQALLLRRIPPETIFTPCLSQHGLRHMTALHYAVEDSGRTGRDMLKMLLRYIPKDMKDQIDMLGQGEVERRHYGLQRKYRNALDFEDYTALCWACLFANVEAVQLLLNNGASPNSSESHQCTTPLIAICSRSSTSEQNEEARIIMLLLRAGAKLDAEDSKGNTAVHYLLQRPPFKLARLLLSRASSSNTKLTSKNVHGWTLLHCVAFYCHSEDAHELVRAILDNGIPIHAKNRHGLTAFELAEKYGNEQATAILRPYEELYRRKISKQISSPIVPTLPNTQNSSTSSPPIASPDSKRPDTAPQPTEGPFKPPAQPPKLPERQAKTPPAQPDSKLPKQSPEQLPKEPGESTDDTRVYPDYEKVPRGPIIENNISASPPLQPKPEHPKPIRQVSFSENATIHYHETQPKENTAYYGIESFRVMAEKLLTLGEFRNAEIYYRNTFPQSERFKQPNHFVSLFTVWKLAIASYDAGAWPESASLYRGLLGLCESQGADNQMAFDIAGNLSLVYLTAEMYKEADPLTLRALQGKERVFGPSHENTLDMVLAVGNAKVGLRDLLNAAVYYNRILDSPIPANHRLRIRARNGWGDIYALQGKYHQAEAMYNEVVEAIKSGVLQGTIAERIDISRDFRNLYRMMGDWSRAEKYCRELLQARTDAYGPEHPEVIETIEDLSFIIEKQRLSPIIPTAVSRQPLPSITNTTDAARGGNPDSLAEPPVDTEGNSSSPSLVQIQYRLSYARKEHDLRHYEVAEQLYKEILPNYERLIGPESPETLQVLEEYAVTLCRTNRNTMLEARAPKFGDYVDAVSSGWSYVEAERRYKASIPMFERVIAGREKLPSMGANHPETIRAVFACGSAMVSADATDQLPLAERHFKRGLSYYDIFYGKENQDTLNWMLYVAERYCTMAHKKPAEYSNRLLAEAEDLTLRVVEIRDRLCGRKDKDTLKAIESLADVYRAQNRINEAKQLEKRLPARMRVVQTAFGGLVKSFSKLDGNPEAS